MKDWCENCIHIDKSINLEPCKSCKITNDKTMTNFVEKSCENCKHSYCGDLDEPCFGCEPYGEDNWELATDDVEEACVEEKPTDTISHPEYYQGKYECIEEMIELFGIEVVKGFCMCNVYKYRFRAGRKQGEEYKKDVTKAEDYMTLLIELKERTVNSYEINSK